MTTKDKFRVLRLNAHTYPMLPEERKVLSDADLTVIEIEGNTDEEILKYAAEVDALMIVSSYLRSPVIRQLKKCRIISRLGTGVDKIDIAEATRQGIYVTNLPDFCTNEVADHTLALLLAVARQLKYYEIKMHEGKQPHDVKYVHRLSAQTAGLIGFGRIARAVAKRLLAFGMKVLAYDPKMNNDLVAKEGVTPADLDTVLKNSDYVCVLCPLLPTTRGMIAMNELKKMKSSAVLVNTARGEIINENDLVTALREGIIRYAAIDVFGGINVFQPNGFETNHPFFTLENILLTPHVAAFSQESSFESSVRGAQAVVEVLTGNKPSYPVNPEVKPWFVS